MYSTAAPRSRGWGGGRRTLIFHWRIVLLEGNLCSNYRSRPGSLQSVHFAITHCCYNTASAKLRDFPDSTRKSTAWNGFLRPKRKESHQTMETTYKDNFTETFVQSSAKNETSPIKLK
jgi:hypothetical protein